MEYNYQALDVNLIISAYYLKMFLKHLLIFSCAYIVASQHEKENIDSVVNAIFKQGEGVPDGVPENDVSILNNFFIVSNII